MINPVMYSGVTGIQNGQANMQKAATEIAQMNRPQSTANDTSVEESLVGLEQAKIQTLASTKVVEAADETIGTLLDIRA